MIYKITYSKEFKRANLHNCGCNFNCAWCSYKLKKADKEKKFLTPTEIKKILANLDIDRVHFVGGEPTTYPRLSEISDFAKNELGAYTKIGHSNGFNMPPNSIDAMSISLKSFSNDIYRKYIGKSNTPVLKNFVDIYKQGIEVSASSVFIPGLVECDEIEKISKFIAQIDPEIHYHITGYVPVSGAPWRSPTYDEIKKAKMAADRYLNDVDISWFPSVTEYIEMTKVTPKYQSVRVA